MRTAMRQLKQVTVRLPEDDLELIDNEARELGVAPGVVIRMIVRQALRHRPQSPENAQRNADALRAAIEAVSSQPEAQGLTEADLLDLSRAARRRLAGQTH